MTHLHHFLSSKWKFEMIQYVSQERDLGKRLKLSTGLVVPSFLSSHFHPDFSTELDYSYQLACSETDRWLTCFIACQTHIYKGARYYFYFKQVNKCMNIPIL